MKTIKRESKNGSTPYMNRGRGKVTLTPSPPLTPVLRGEEPAEVYKIGDKGWATVHDYGEYLTVELVPFHLNFDSTADIIKETVIEVYELSKQWGEVNE